jgi:hypothetical protein
MIEWSACGNFIVVRVIDGTVGHVGYCQQFGIEWRKPVLCTADVQHSLCDLYAIILVVERTRENAKYQPAVRHTVGAVCGYVRLRCIYNIFDRPTARRAALYRHSNYQFVSGHCADPGLVGTPRNVHMDKSAWCGRDCARRMYSGFWTTRVSGVAVGGNV